MKVTNKNPLSRTRPAAGGMCDPGACSIAARGVVAGILARLHALALVWRRRGAPLAAALAVVSLAAAPIAHATIGTPQGSLNAGTITYQMTYTGTPQYTRLFLDTDRNSATGYLSGGVGAEFLVETDALYRYSGSGGSNWAWTRIRTLSFNQSGGVVQWSVPYSDLGSPSAIDFVGQIDPPQETSAKVTEIYTSGQLNTVSYAGSSAIVANPERGFYNGGGHCENNAFSQAVLQAYRVNDANTLVLCEFYLENFKTSAIGTAALNFLQAQMDTVRAAGLKVLVRFAYTESTTGNDASLTRVLSHMDQLAPYFAQNSDVMFVVQEGFIGAWGEGAFSQNFGNGGSLSNQNILDRKAVADKLLQVLPANRMMQIRTPLLKTLAFGTTALLPSEAFNGTPKARVGHHNDCFLKGSTDAGTYTNQAIDYPYLEAETTYTPMGGETCGLSAPRTDCPTALTEMAKFHWTYINLNYHPDVLNAWRSQGCFDTIKRSLGYRFALQNGSYATSGKPGGTIYVSFIVRNDGWAAPFNARSVDLVLRNTSTGALVRLPLNTDPRLWLAGQSVTVAQMVGLPSTMASGNYAAFLSLPDAAPGLAARPEYAIQFANANVWDAASGMNNLNHTMNVAP